MIMIIDRELNQAMLYINQYMHTPNILLVKLLY